MNTISLNNRYKLINKRDLKKSVIKKIMMSKVNEIWHERCWVCVRKSDGMKMSDEAMLNQHHPTERERKYIWETVQVETLKDKI